MSHTINDSKNISHNTNSFDVWNNYTFTDDRSQLLAWLSPLEPSLKHRELRERRVRVSGIGLYRLRNSEDGAEWVGKVEVEMIMLFCSAMEIRVPERHSSGNKDYSLGREKSKPRLTSHDDSSLVVDRLCHLAKGQNMAVTCFYSDFAARKEQSAAGV